MVYFVSSDGGDLKIKFLFYGLCLIIRGHFKNEYPSLCSSFLIVKSYFLILYVTHYCFPDQ